MVEVANELMLVISTLSSVLAGIAALTAELRVRRRDRRILEAPTLTTHPSPPLG